jgi:restriction endonuclease S subunit
MVGSRTIGDYVSLQRGTTYKGNLVGKPGPALLGLGSIHPGGGFRSDYKTYGGECPEKLMLYPGDLFVSLKGATKDSEMIGSIARVPALVSSGRLTQDTVRLVFHESDHNVTAFLYWLLRTPHYRRYCAGRATGSAVVALSREDFLGYPVPPLSAGRACIIRLLEHIESKIELNRKMNETLEAMACAIFKSWFVDFDPVGAKAEGRQPSGMDAETAELFPDAFEDSSLGKIPKGWQIAVLKDHIDANRGLSYTGDGLGDTGVPLHNLDSVLEGGGYKYAGLKHYAGGYDERHIVRPGDMIVANTEQGFDFLLVGFPAIIPKCFGEPGIFTHHLYRVAPKPKSPLSVAFLYRLLMSHRVRGQVVGCTNGTTVNMLPRDGLERPQFVLPPEKLVRAFDELARPAIEKQELHHAESQTLVTIRDTLLPKLISGEIRVNHLR